MGGGSYSYTNAVDDSVRRGFATNTLASSAGADMSTYKRKGVREVFSRRDIHNDMNPFGVKIREARDSEEHPESRAIIIALDVTGSMEDVPHHLIGEGFPNIMGTILQAGVKDPQVLFMGIGDHECDQAPLQIGQFESSDELMNHWLTQVYLEGGGGGNAGESYLLAWYFAAMHTEIDCWEKRKQKGILFTIGDEPPLMNIPGSALKGIMGEGQYGNYRGSDLLEKVREHYNVYHIHIQETYRGRREDSKNAWGQLLGENLLVAQNHTEVPKIIARHILRDSGMDESLAEVDSSELLEKAKSEPKSKDERPPKML